MKITAYKIAQRFIGMKEVSGTVDNPQILAMLKLDADWPEHDEVPWCSAFVNYVAWILSLPRSKSLMARSWETVGIPIPWAVARPAWDVVILSRSGNPELGHVGFYANIIRNEVYVLGGNQDNAVSVESYSADRIVDIRRLIV